MACRNVLACAASGATFVPSCMLAAGPAGPRPQPQPPACGVRRPAQLHVASAARSATIARTSTPLACGAATGALAAALCARRERRLRRARQSGRAGLPKDFESLPPDEQARVALLERQGLRQPSDFSEDEKQQLAQQMDVLSDYRTVVNGFGGLLAVAALQDVLFYAFNSARGIIGDEPDRVILIVFLAAAGAGLLYVGNVLMAPPPVPSIVEMVKQVEEQEAARRKAEQEDREAVTRALIGIWCYGKDGGQTYEISYDSRGTLRYIETLADKSYSATLQQKGRWLWGYLVDGDGKAAGVLRVRAGEEPGSAVSSVALPGEKTWGNKNVARRRVVA